MHAPGHLRPIVWSSRPLVRPRSRSFRDCDGQTRPLREREPPSRRSNIIPVTSLFALASAWPPVVHFLRRLLSRFRAMQAGAKRLSARRRHTGSWSGGRRILWYLRKSVARGLGTSRRSPEVGAPQAERSRLGFICVGADQLHQRTRNIAPGGRWERHRRTPANVAAALPERTRASFHLTQKALLGSVFMSCPFLAARAIRDLQVPVHHKARNQTNSQDRAREGGSIGVRTPATRREGGRSVSEPMASSRCPYGVPHHFPSQPATHERPTGRQAPGASRRGGKKESLQANTARRVRLGHPPPVVCWYPSLDAHTASIEMRCLSFLRASC